jgi:hypothetical protein
VLDLRQREHARQHGAPYAEPADVKVDRLVRRRRGLHGQVESQRGVPLRGVLHEARIGEDHGVESGVGGEVERVRPAGERRGLRVRVEGEQHLCPARVRVREPIGGAFRVEVESGEVARIGLVAQSDVDAVRARVDRGLQRRQRSRRADEVDATLGHAVRAARCRRHSAPRYARTAPSTVTPTPISMKRP